MAMTLVQYSDFDSLEGGYPGRSRLFLREARLFLRESFGEWWVVMVLVVVAVVWDGQLALLDVSSESS